MPYAAAIFDMDGLLIDSERTIRRLWLAQARARGVALDEATYAAVIGVSGRDADAVMRGWFAEADFEQVRAAVAAALVADDPAQTFPVKAGARELLQALRERGVRCAVASSTATPEVERRLRGVGLRASFEYVVGGDRVPRGKPSPDVYLDAARALGVDASRCLAFEDSRHGVAAAAAAGMPVVLVPDLVAPSSETVASALVQLDSLNQAMPRLDAWFGPAARA